jgi:hypothetical protein
MPSNPLRYRFLRDSHSDSELQSFGAVINEVGDRSIRNPTVERESYFAGPARRIAPTAVLGKGVPNTVESRGGQFRVTKTTVSGKAAAPDFVRNSDPFCAQLSELMKLGV